MPETVLLFGPPGTGKTTQLSRFIRGSAKRWGPDRVLVTSFSKAAARELVERNLQAAEAALDSGEEVLKIPDENIATLHALGYRAIGKPRLAETKEGIEAWNSDCQSSGRRPWVLTGGVVSDVDEGGDGFAESSKGDELFAALQLLRARMTPEEAWPLSVRSFASRWGTWKQAHALIDFTDMIEIPLRDSVYAPGAPTVIFSDESQDLSRLESSLLLHWAERADQILFALDDDQSVYHFKGSDASIFLSMEAKRRTVLDQSYRVPKAVLDVSTRWIGRVKEREPKVYRPRVEGGVEVEGSLHLLRGADANRPEKALPIVEASLANGKSVMLLASCAYLLEPTKQLLRKEGIPFHNPYRTKRGDWNPLLRGSEKRQMPADRILAYLLPDPTTWGQGAAFWTPQALGSVLDVLQSDGLLVRGAKTRVEQWEVEDREIGAADVAALFKDEGEFAHFWECDLDWFGSHLLPKKAGALAFPLHVARKRGGAALRAEPQVVIGTIHSVKGGQADTVILYPDISRAAYTGWARRGSPEHDALIRLYYVALTRARESVYLCDPATPLEVGLSRLFR